MKLETLQERLVKAQEKVARKETTIVKKLAQIEKKSDVIRKLDADPDTDNIRQYDERSTWHDIYWTFCDLNTLRDDIKRLRKEIEETRTTIAKYEAQIAGEIERERLFCKEIPEILKTLESQLIEAWDADDKARRDYLRGEYKKLGYSEFIKHHHYRGYEYMGITDEQIHGANVNDSRALVLDLYNRVKAITGEVTDWSGIYATQGTHGIAVLNGFVAGKEGRAAVESIFAGGYNIQKLHVRVLVKEIR